MTLLVAGSPAWKKAVEIAKQRTGWVRPNPAERYPGELEEVGGAGSDATEVGGEAQAEA